MPMLCCTSCVGSCRTSPRPVQPIILAAQEEPGMVDFDRRRPSFLSVHRYTDQEQLLADLGDKVIRPAELSHSKLRRDSRCPRGAQRKARRMRRRGLPAKDRSPP